MTKTKVIVAWSGGKDSAMALYRLQREGIYEIHGLLTTMTERYDRVQMHGVRRILLEAQAEALGIRLIQVWVPYHADNATYEEAMRQALSPLLAQGVSAVAYGDLFLEDIRAYREELLAASGLRGLYPVWGENTAHMAKSVIEEGFQATLVCIDPAAIGPDFAGRRYDHTLLADLPPGVDPCGENGEFHTFVHDGPNFRYPLATMRGITVERSGFVFADLLPVVGSEAKSVAHSK